MSELIIIRVWGGLGNQLFQYACAKALALKYNCALKIDPSLLYKDLENPLTIKRDLDLEVFNIPITIASREEISFFNPEPKKLLEKIYVRLKKSIYRPKQYIEPFYHFDDDFNKVKPSISLIGNFQSFKYFEDYWPIIKEELTFKHPLLPESQELNKEIEKSNSICITIRRGDYVWHPEYSKILGFRGLEYFNPAIDYLRSKVESPKFFIFADDKDWAKENFKDHDQFIVDDVHDGWKFSNKLQLMVACKHHIIANSTFGWWAAWLGAKPGQVVLAPKVWYQDTSFNTRDLCPESWIRL